MTTPPDLYDHVHILYARLADLCGKLELLAAVAQGLPPDRIDHTLRRLAQEHRVWLAQQQRPRDRGAEGGCGA